jgi:hypothetical protein
MTLDHFARSVLVAADLSKCEQPWVSPRISESWNVVTGPSPEFVEVTSSVLPSRLCGDGRAEPDPICPIT